MEKLFTGIHQEDSSSLAFIPKSLVALKWKLHCLEDGGLHSQFLIKKATGKLNYGQYADEMLFVFYLNECNLLITHGASLIYL